MAIILPSGFNITSTDPVDARFTVTNQAARYGLAIANIYPGLLVYQQDVKLTYVLIDTTNVANSNGWQVLITGGSSVSGSQTISGSLNVLGSITGSLQGTASFAISASYVTLAQTASFFSGSVSNAISSSYATTSSFSLYSVTSSFSLTSSLLAYQGTTARVSSNPSSIFLIQSGSNTVFNVDQAGNIITNGSIALETTGSYLELISIKNNGTEYAKVNGEGVLVLHQYSTPPTAVTGGLYFDNVGDLFIGM